MIISRTPLRVSFAGGGSDLAEYYRYEPGAVLSTTIDKYIYITVNKKFDNRIRASYSITEIVEQVAQIKHELIREAMELVHLDGGIEITSVSDIPSEGTGLGSSSSYTVGVLNALHAYVGQFADPERLAREACEIEIERCHKPIGKQDQYIAAYGGLKYIQFNPDESVFVDPVICTTETRRAFQEHLLMLYTGITRSADGILRAEKSNIDTDPVKRQGLQRLTVFAQDLRMALHQNDIRCVGEILHANWLQKKQLAAGISTARIDAWYETARQHGAQGGKILGAGGGGFLMLFAAPERHAEIANALPGLRPVPFRLDQQGSKIIYVETNERRSSDRPLGLDRPAISALQGEPAR